MMLIRDVIIFVGALGVGSLINAAIYGLAYRSRPISPWTSPPKDVPRRSWRDCVPVIGWFRLRREESIHGRWFWIRPILIELFYAAGIVWLFHFETANGLLPVALKLPSYWHHIFAVHALLIALLTAATFIDFDEQSIPDLITLPGTFVLLILMTIWPQAQLPTVYNAARGVLDVEPLLFNSKESAAWPAGLNGGLGLTIALGIVWLWWFALQPGTTTMRHGWRKAIDYYIVSLLRLRPRHQGVNRSVHRPTYRKLLWELALVFAGISAAIAGVWWFGGVRWQSLFTSLVGLGCAGGLVWGVRIGGYIGLRREAMGFGDATLMAMIGVALGWQASLLVFFVSPFTAVFVAVTKWLLTRRDDIAFGPYLSLAAVVVIVCWVGLWENYSRTLFEMDLLIPYTIVSFLLLMTGMLWIWRLFKENVLKIDS